MLQPIRIIRMCTARKRNQPKQLWQISNNFRCCNLSFVQGKITSNRKQPFSYLFYWQTRIACWNRYVRERRWEKYTNNSNFFVLGPSGSGKSFYVNSKVRQWVLDNTDIVLVDTGHSYSGMCEYYHGKYITYSESKPISMNPFRITEEEYNVEKKNFLKSLIFLIWKGANGEVKSKKKKLWILP